jgi:rubrerythrin
MNAAQTISELTRLYTLEVEATEAYAAGVHAVGPGPIQEELTRFWLEHQKHALELHLALLARGRGAPAVTPDVKGVVIGALTPPRRRLTLEDVLEGLRGNEQLTNQVCAKLVAASLDPDARALVERIAADERGHLARLDTLVRRRVWEAGAAASP